MVQNFPNMMETINQESQQTPDTNTRNMKQMTSRHIIIKMLENFQRSQRKKIRYREHIKKDDSQLLTGDNAS